MAYAPRIALTESPRINSQCALMFGVPAMLAEAVTWCVATRKGRDRLLEFRTLEEMIRLAGYAESTAEKYAEGVEEFCDWFGRTPFDAGPEDVRAFLTYKGTRGAFEARQRLLLAGLRTVMDRLLGCAMTVDVEYAPRPEARHGAPADAVRATFDRALEPEKQALLRLLHVEDLRPGIISRAREEDLVGSCLRYTSLIDGEEVVRRAHLSPGTLALLTGLLSRRRERRTDSPAGGDSRIIPMTVRGIEKYVARTAARAGTPHITPTGIRKCLNRVLTP